MGLQNPGIQVGMGCVCHNDPITLATEQLNTTTTIQPNSDSGPLTFAELVIACKNIGYDLNCGACASIFYCGFALPGDEHTCERVVDNPS